MNNIKFSPRNIIIIVHCIGEGACKKKVNNSIGKDNHKSATFCKGRIIIIHKLISYSFVCIINLAIVILCYREYLRKHNSCTDIVKFP